jgi:hypothetical protein
MWALPSNRRYGRVSGVAWACLLSLPCLVCCVFCGFAQTNSSYTFQRLYPNFLKTRIVPAYAQHESSTSPATYNASNGDFHSEFVSPSGKQVTITIKAPVTIGEYNVPPISYGQTAYDYLNNALYDAKVLPRTRTTITIPKNTYNFDFGLYSNCTSTTDHQPKYVHWQLPMGASDLVIDGQGSTINFSDLCLGLNLPNVKRVTLKNFTFAWPNLEIGAVGTIVAVGGNGNTGYTYDVKIAPPLATLPKMIAATTSWDKAANHWDLEKPDDDVSYGDGVTSGVPLTCTESARERQNTGCTVKNVPSYGALFKVGESVLLRYYSFATAISASGDDITLDHITLKNLIGSDFTYSQGRGLHVTHLLLTRMDGRPISAGGGGSLLTNVGGDVVMDNSWLGYQSDDALDMNTTIIRYTPTQVVNNTPMNSFVFDQSRPDTLSWPAYNVVQVGDVIGIFDNALSFMGVATVKAVSTPPNSSTSTLTLDRYIDSRLGRVGFIAGDLTNSAGARYIIRGNHFEFNRARALLLQTPYGWVDNNHFIGQTMKEIYALASQHWGEGPGAQELILTNNEFNGAKHAAGFYALDVMAEAANFSNAQDEVVGMESTAPPINQNIVVAGNRFTADKPANLVNLSSANNIVFVNNVFYDSSGMDDGRGQRPVSVHDAANIYFGRSNRYSWLTEACVDSQLYALSSPPPVVSAITPVACGIWATVSNFIFEGPR